MDFSSVKRIVDLVDFQLKNAPREDSLVRKINGKWQKTSTLEFKQESDKISLAMLAMGLQPGDKVALITTTNRTEWNIMDMGLLNIGVVDVPLYPTITSEDYQYIMNDAEVKYCFVSDKALADKVNAVKKNIPSLLEIYTFEKVEGYKHWSEVQNKASEEYRSRLNEIKDKIQEDDLATIIYTSGTTGVPKGVMLSHKNLISNAQACTERIPYGPGYKSLSFLPICHVYERLKHYLYMMTGIGIYYAESMDTIGDNLKEVKPHVFSAVPRLLEKVYDRIMAKGNELTGIKRKLFFWSLRLAENYDPHKRGFYRLKLAIARKLVFSKWQEALGGNVLAVASGSAALQPRLARIYLGAGINVWEGYGLTETSPVIAVNCNKNDGIRIGTVGRVLSNVKVMIAEDGEILVKGPNVMLGYYKKQAQTDEVIDEKGWFHTGDIGEFVDGDFLKITDRKKEMFKTSGGKYVAPQKIENSLKESPFIEQVAVIGNNQKFPSALIVPAFEALEKWAASNGIAGTRSELVKNDKIIELFRSEVENVNKGLGNWEQIKKPVLLDKEFTIDGGELTPTLKLKRKAIDAKYQDLINKIYA